MDDPNTGYRVDRRGRLPAIIVALALQALLALVLLRGLAVPLSSRIVDDLKVFSAAPPTPPPVRVAQRRSATRHRGHASPANRRSKATDVVAPPPVVPPITPPPIVTAPLPGVGSEASGGAALRPGPGTGSGGVGAGTGSGDGGNGDGNGDGETPLRLIRGAIRQSDRPRETIAPGVGGTTRFLFTVGVRGRVTDCRVTASSGNPQLDALTCRLVVDRFRYRPTLDAAGRPVPEQVDGSFTWHVPEDAPVEQ